MTVSNVINGTGKASEATRARVRASIEALNFRPNAAARALASPAATRIGIVYADAQNAFLSAMLVGTLHGAAKLGAQLMVEHCGTASAAAVAESLRSLVRGGANALLLPPPYSELVAGSAVLGELGVPVAAIAAGHAMPGMFTVRVDDRGAARAMTDLLVGQGHRRIGFIAGPESHSSTAARRDGYRDSLASHGLAMDDALIAAGEFTFESGLAAAEALLALPQPPSAIFACSDDLAGAVVAVAARRDLRIPQDLAVAGFDDTPIATKLWPTLTTVRQPIAAMAELATTLLAGQARNAMPSEGEDRLVPFELIERESTAG
jgi:LacI family transcriptional regulator